MKNTPLGLVLSMMLSGCMDGIDLPGDQNADLEAVCTDEQVVLEFNQNSSLGFSASAVIAALEGEYHATLTYSDGTVSPLTIILTYEGGSVSEVAYNLSGWDDQSVPQVARVGVASECQRYVQIASSLEFYTEDERFMEVWNINLLAVGVSAASFQVEVSDLVGSYGWTTFNPYDYSSWSILVHGTLEEQKSAGVISEQATSSAAVPGTGTETLSQAEIASWPSDPPNGSSPRGLRF